MDGGNITWFCELGPGWGDGIGLKQVWEHARQAPALTQMAVLKDCRRERRAGPAMGKTEGMGGTRDCGVVRPKQQAVGNRQYATNSR